MDVDAAVARLVVVGRREALLDEPLEMVADARLAGLVAEVAREDPVLDAAAHAGHASARPARRTMWQVEVPMIMTIVPGLGDRRRGDGHVRVDVRHGHRGPGRQAGPGARPRPTGRRPARRPATGRGASCVSTTSAKPRVEGAEVGRRPGSRRASTTSPCSRRCRRCGSRRRSVARRPSRPPRSAGPRRRRPRAPRRGSGAPSRRTTPTRSSRRSGRARPAPVARATSLIRSASGWAAWCFQSLTQACGFDAEGGQLAEGRPVGRGRQHRAGGQVDPDADDVGRIHAGGADDLRDGGLEDVAGSRRDPGAPSRAAGPRRRPARGAARR